MCNIYVAVLVMALGPWNISIVRLGRGWLTEGNSIVSIKRERERRTVLLSKRVHFYHSVLFAGYLQQNCMLLDTYLH